MPEGTEAYQEKMAASRKAQEVSGEKSARTSDAAGDDASEEVGDRDGEKPEGGSR